MNEIVLLGVHLTVCGECKALTRTSDAESHLDWHIAQREARDEAIAAADDAHYHSWHEGES